MREKVLELLHEQHIGIVRMKMLARSEVWWPGLDDDIERYVSVCETCQKFRSAQKETFSSWSRANGAWQRIHMDFFQKFGKYFLLIVDSYSRWMDVHIVSSTNAEDTINKLRSTCSILGLPVKIVTDNGPPFNGEQFKRFCQVNGIQHILTPPLHPKSNGNAEKYVDVVKRNLVKQMRENENSNAPKSLNHLLENFLLKHRTTPSAVNGCSPADSILKITPRTKLHLLRPSTLKHCEGSQNKSSDATKMYYEGENV